MKKRTLPEVNYDKYDYEEEDVDVLVVPGESLELQKVLEPHYFGHWLQKVLVIIDWRPHSIFRTRAFSGGKVRNVILDGSSSENIISEKAIEKIEVVYR